MNREAKLIAKLFRKIAGHEAIHDAVNELVALFVPSTARLGEYELDAAVSRLVVTRQQAICQTVKRIFVLMIEFPRPDISFHLPLLHTKDSRLAK
jgi:hypothetical protein